MKSKDLAAAAKAANPDLAKLSNKDAVALITGVFAAIGGEIGKAQNGEAVRIAGLGAFVVRDTEATDEKPARRRVVFRPAAAQK